MVRVDRQFILPAVALFVALNLAVVFVVGLSSVGRTTLYQGMQFTWEGAEVESVVYQWCGFGAPGDQGVPINHFYEHDDLHTFTKVGGDDSGSHTASVSDFLGSTFNLDIDEVDLHSPNLRGSVDDPFPHELTAGNDGLFQTYEWNVGVPGSFTDVHIEMDEWIFETNFNVVASPTSSGEKAGRYADTKLWLKIEPFIPTYLITPDLEFKSVHFALAALEIEEITLGFGKLSQEELDRFGIRDANSPTSFVGANLNEGLEVTVFFDAPNGNPITFGTSEQAAREKVRSFFYRGIELDPEVFQPVYYVPIEITSFGSDLEEPFCFGWG